MMVKRFIFILTVSIALTGCSGIKNPFNQGVDNTVLPGTRESVLAPGEQVTGKSTVKSTKSATVLGTADPTCEPANPDYPECLTPPDPAAPSDSSIIDEESTVAQ